MSDSEGPKKETVRITLPPRVRPGEARETVRINMPARTPAIANPAQSSPRPPPPGAPGRTAPPPVRPSLAAPIRPPVFSRPAPPPPPPSVLPPPPPRVESVAAPPEPLRTPPPPPQMPPRPRVLPPPPRIIPPAAPSSSVAAAPAIYPGSAAHAGPKKETARISILPQPSAPRAPTVKMTKTQPLMIVPQAKVHNAPVTVAPVLDPIAAASSFAAIPLPICWTILGISAVTLLIQIWNYFAS